MGSGSDCRKISATFKAAVVLEALKEHPTISELTPSISTCIPIG